ncbi:hypothetical protein M8494_38060, partial [Serratia ureilytica]
VRSTLKTRQDVTEALESAGFEVVRTTKAASALPTRTGAKHPTEGPSMNSLLTLAKDLEQKSKAQQQTTGEMRESRIQRAREAVRAESGAKARRESRRHPRPRPEAVSAMSQRTKGMLRMVSQTWLTIVLVSALLIASSAGIVVAGAADTRELYDHPEQKSTQAMLSRGTAAYSSRPAASRDATA